MQSLSNIMFYLSKVNKLIVFIDLKKRINKIKKKFFSSKLIKKHIPANVCINTPLVLDALMHLLSCTKHKAEES